MLTFGEFLDLWSKAPEEIKKKVEEMLDAKEQKITNDNGETSTMKGE